MRAIEDVLHYAAIIQDDFPGFEDDGLSGGFPDWLYARHHLSLAGRVHDWHYCSRCHPQGTMNQAHRAFADTALRVHARELLPWYLRIAPWLLYAGVRIGGGGSAWNSCGPTRGERCRHNIETPAWMKIRGVEEGEP